LPKKLRISAELIFFEADLKPENKVEFIEKYKEKNKSKQIAMIGDG